MWTICVFMWFFLSRKLVNACRKWQDLMNSWLQGEKFKKQILKWTQTWTCLIGTGAMFPTGTAELKREECVPVRN